MTAPASREDAFRAFMGERWPRLLRSAYLLTGNPHAAEDLAQSAFERCYGAWRRVQRADDPDAYVRRILINLHRRRHRSPRREYLTDGGTVPDVPDAPGAGPAAGGAESATDRADTRPALLAALGRLPVRRRQTLVLRFWEDLSIEQTAHALQCSAGTVKSQTAKALARLRTAGELDGVLPRRAEELT